MRNPKIFLNYIEVGQQREYINKNNYSYAKIITFNNKNNHFSQINFHLEGINIF